MQAEDLAEAIRETIRGSGKTLGQLAAVTAVDKSALSRFLRSERTITVETADRLLAALGYAVSLKGPKAAAPPAKAKGRKGSKGKPSNRPAKG